MHIKAIKCVKPFLVGQLVTRERNSQILQTVKVIGTARTGMAQIGIKSWKWWLWWSLVGGFRVALMAMPRTLNTTPSSSCPVSKTINVSFMLLLLWMAHELPLRMRTVAFSFQAKWEQFKPCSLRNHLYKTLGTCETWASCWLQMLCFCLGLVQFLSSLASQEDLRPSFSPVYMPLTKIKCHCIVSWYQICVPDII